MEFNRLLSQAISFYGESGDKDFNETTVKKVIKLILRPTKQFRMKNSMN